jgi:hypothetical protein
MSSWDALGTELDAWAAAGQTATFWWRDDDATAATPALETLLGRAGRLRVPLCLAVIPAAADPTLAARIAEAPLVSVTQHGYAHRNWAAPGAKKAELAENRRLAEMTDELVRGFAALALTYGARSKPVLVPPWNRIAAALLPHLPGLGFHGLSTYGTRQPSETVPGLRQANAHVDPIDWRGTRGFVGEAIALALLLKHLKARRTGSAGASEATGLLTHHAVEDAASRQFADRLIMVTATHPAARWLSIDQVLADA